MGFLRKRVKLENSIPSEVTQAQKQLLHVLLLVGILALKF